MVADPICATGRCGPFIGRVSHPDDTGAASTYVCRAVSHQEDAARWVHALTGVTGEFFPFTRKAV